MGGALRAFTLLAATILPYTVFALAAAGVEGLATGPLLALLLLGLPATLVTGEPLLGLAGSAAMLLAIAWRSSRGGLKRLAAATALVYAYIAVTSLLVFLSAAASGL